MEFVEDEDLLHFENRGRRRRVFRQRVNMVWPVPESFRMRFRVSPDVATLLENSTAAYLQHPTNRNMALTPRQQLLIALRFLATGSFYHLVADGHGPSASTVCRVVRRVTGVLIQKFAGVVRWPTDAQELDGMREAFHAIAGLPDVVGCIDGTYVAIDVPKESKETYMCRKGYTALNVMGVSGADRRCVAASVHCTGRVHDARVLRTSGLPEYFRGTGGPVPNGLLLGDSAYPLAPWLLTPVANPRTAAEQGYNKAHSKTRVAVENMFGIMKMRFPVLKGGIRLKTVAGAVDVVRTCIIIHNICCMGGDFGDWLEEQPGVPHPEELPEAAEEAHAEGAERRAGERRRQEIVRLFG